MLEKTSSTLTFMMIAMKNYLLFPLLFLSCLCFPVSSYSQENDPIPKTLPSEDEIPDYFKGSIGHETDTFQTKFINMLVILGLLIGFMILASWALKRMMRTRLANLNTGSTIKVLETRQLSPRAVLHLVEVQGQTVLIAESPTTVSYLATFPLEEEART